ncbi:MAG: SBBP repeat-containing protein [Ignavibacteria bacterium]
MAVDRLGNVYISGWINTNNQGTDMVTVKYSASGVQQWVAVYNEGGPGSNDLVEKIATDTLGNIYVCGYSGINFGPYHGVLIKYNTNGNQVWARVYYGPTGQGAGFTAMAIDRQNNIYVIAGRSTLKYNTNGDSIWVRVFTGGGGSRSIALDPSGNVYLGGMRTMSFPPNTDCLVIKYDSSGALQWYVYYDGSYNDVVRKITVDVSGNAYIAGYIDTAAAPWQYFLTIKYNSAGIQQWVRRYTGPSNSPASAFSIITDKLGNAYVTGWSSGTGSFADYTTIKYNSNGDSLWVRRYNGPGSDNDEAYAIAIDDSANVYVTGRSIGTGTSWDYATIKYNSSGLLQWVMRYNNNPPGNGDDIPNDVFVDEFMNVYVTGSSDAGGFQYDYATVKYSQLVGIKTISNEIPNEYKLWQNYPQSI